MEKSASKSFGWPIAAVLLLGGVGAAVWFSQQQPSVPAKPAPAAATTPAATPARQLPASSLDAKPAPMTATAEAPEAPLSGRGAAAVEEIDTVLRDQSISTDDAAKRLVALAADGTVPEKIRNDALQHAMNLLPDEGFASLEGMLKTKETPPELLDLVFHEIHNRPVDVQLPTALLLMQRSGEEVSQQARELLSFHLEKDLGDDPAAWTSTVQEATAKAKAENAAVGVQN
jgi:hypothetical protein